MMTEHTNPALPAKRTRATGPGPHPYLRGATWWVRVPQRRPPAERRSLETNDKRRALAQCAMLRAFVDSANWEVLEAIAQEEFTIDAVYAAWSTGTLRAFMAAHAEAANDPDLEPYVAEWLTAMQDQRPKVAEEYHRMVRTLFVEDVPFARSKFRKSAVRTWLDGRRPKTRNRYRVSASSFAAYLCERELLEFNVVLSVKATAERPPRARYLTRDEAQALVQALPQPHRALHALLLATGADVSAALRICYRDIDVKAGTVRIAGTKAHTRDAVRHMTESWARDEFTAFIRHSPGMPLAQVFAELLDDDSDISVTRAQDRTLNQLKKACKLEHVKIKDYATRDHRHTFAVQALKDGYSYAVVAFQLGHATTALVHKVYGRHVPSAADYTRRTEVTTEAATKQAAVRASGQL